MGLTGKTSYKFILAAALATFMVIKLLGLISSRETPVRSGEKSFGHEVRLQSPVLDEPTGAVPRKYQDRPNTILKEDCQEILKKYQNEKHEAILNSTVWNKVKYLLFFFGHGRSGTTLVSALLDAHPNMIVSTEYDAIGKWMQWGEKQRTRDHLFQDLYSRSFELARVANRAPLGSCRNSFYNFHVSRQWQGKFDKVIKVIGDKTCDKFLELLVMEPKTPEQEKVLPSIQKAVKVPFKFIYILRNPFDVAATRMYRKTNLGVKESKRETLYGNPLAYNKKLQGEVVNVVKKVVKAAIEFTKRPGVDTIHIYSEDIIENPAKELKKLCKFLEVSCSEDYLRDCSSIIFKSPRKTRNTIKWDDDAKNVINQMIQEEPLFKRYKFNT